MATAVRTESMLLGRAGDQWPLPWLAEPLATARTFDRSHAMLIHGPAGVGHLEFAGLLAQAWLCEEPGQAPCGTCGSCHLVSQRAHPDLHILVPDALRVALGWQGDDEGAGRSDAKPSREIRVDAVRQAIDWSHRTTGRARGKALIIHPADQLNTASANALLKTLEEPAGRMRLWLTTTDPERLLPTVRSRCQHLHLGAPDAASACTWLRGRGLAHPEALLALAGGSPLLALELAAEGVDADWIGALPMAVARGDARLLLGRNVARVVDVLFKLAHDLQVRSFGAPARFIMAAKWPASPSLDALAHWQRELWRVARHDEHPWNAALLIESLVTQAASLWPRHDEARTRGGRPSLHSHR